MTMKDRCPVFLCSRCRVSSGPNATARDWIIKRCAFICMQECRAHMGEVFGFMWRYLTVALRFSQCDMQKLDACYISYNNYRGFQGTR